MLVSLRRFHHIIYSAFSAASALRMTECAKKQGHLTKAVPMQVSVATAGRSDVPLDEIRPYHACPGGTTMVVIRRLSRRSRYLATLLLSLSFTSLASSTLAQSSEDAGKDTPLISGAAAFFTRTNGGKTTYSPVLAPLLAAPVGTHLLFESRAALAETWSPTGPNHTYDHVHFVGLNYAQVDYFLNAHVTLAGGYFLIPFGTYNERLTPLWISNLQDAPLIYSLGSVGSGSGTGGEIRGSAVSHENYSIDYTAYISAGTTNFQVNSSRTAGGRVSIYFPKARLEAGTSYARILESTALANDVGFHVWWEPAQIPLKIRSEYAHGAHSQGYWIEADYRLSQTHGPESLIGRLEPVFRMQQTFRNSPGNEDGLPAVNTQQADFGLDYHLPHEVRINTSYSRQFSSTRDVNLWETGIVYRFLFPAWKGSKR
jgi:hypothetical protein